MLAASSGKFLVGDTITLADFAIYCEYRDVDYLAIDASAHENIAKWVEAVEAEPGIAAVHGEGSLFGEALPGIQGVLQG